MSDEKDRTQALLQDAAQRGIRYRVGLNDCGVAPAAAAVDVSLKAMIAIASRTI